MRFSLQAWIPPEEVSTSQAFGQNWGSHKQAQCYHQQGLGIHFVLRQRIRLAMFPPVILWHCHSAFSSHCRNCTAWLRTFNSIWAEADMGWRQICCWAIDLVCLLKYFLFWGTHVTACQDDFQFAYRWLMTEEITRDSTFSSPFRYFTWNMGWFRFPWILPFSCIHAVASCFGADCAVYVNFTSGSARDF